ncbi:MAG: lipopolysaccharide kinase InaA family protein [Planctomycetaceae bacterium]
MFQRAALAEELGELIARLHSRGVVHRDLHGGNILLRPAAGGFRLWLVDLGCRCGFSASVPQRRCSPATWAVFLRHSVLEQLSQADQAAFFHAYWRLFSGNAAGKVLPWHGDQHFAWRELSYRCDEVARCAWEEMDRAWNRGNSKQIVIKTPRILARGLARFGRDQLETRCRLADPDGSSLETIPMASRQMTVGPEETALRVVTRPASSSSPAGASWARHCWNIGHALARRWISAPVPVYVLESRSPGVDWGEVAFAQELGWTLLSSQTSEWERDRAGGGSTVEAGSIISIHARRFISVRD